MKERSAVLLSAIIFILCLALNGTLALAQPPDEPMYREDLSKEKREKVRERIETMRMWKLTQALDLDETTSAKLFPLLNTYDRKRAGIQNEIRSSMKELREALDANQDSALTALMDRLEAGHKKLETIKEDERNELKKVLTPRQQAQFLLFNMKFNHEIQSMIRAARGKGEGAGMDRQRPPRRRDY